MKLIIAIGNTGKEYRQTRHNFGHMAIDALVEKKNLSWHKKKSLLSQVAEFKTNREKVILAKNDTFMNESGRAVRKLKSFYKIPNHKIIIIYDDIAIDFGKIRLSKNRSAGGHNGVDSIIKNLKSKEFKRIRLGIGPQKGKSEDFVLNKFSREEKEKIMEIIDTSHLVIENILLTSFDEATNKYN